MENSGTLLMQGVDEVKELLRLPKSITITTHHKPDADALGSSVALARFLLGKNHDVRIVVPSDYPSFLNWMPNQDLVLNFEEKADREIAIKYIQQSDIVFCLDFSALSRLNDLGDIINAASAKKILIDHHLQPEDFAQYRYWNPAASATAELIFNFICQLGGHDKIDVPMAECIYAGILTDTGGFRHPSTNRIVHLITADLLRIGVVPSRIHKLIYESHSENRLRLLGYILSNKLKVLPEYHTAYISLNKEELSQFEVETGDTEGFVSYPLSIKGIIMAAIIIERNDQVKLSFRSVGDFSVNEFARAHFEGGGHKNAAGGKSAHSLADTEQYFIDLLPNYKNTLEEAAQQFSKELLHSN
jgi:phosphoesterase RecJ-like protein